MAATTKVSTVPTHRLYRDDQGYEADEESRLRGSHENDGITITHDANVVDDDDDNTTCSTLSSQQRGGPINEKRDNNSNKRSLLVAAEDILYLARKRRRVARSINRKHNLVPFGVDIRVVKHMSASELLERHYDKQQSHHHQVGDNDSQSRYMSELHKALTAHHFPTTNKAQHLDDAVGHVQQPIGLSEPGMHWSSQPPVSAEEALNFTSRPRVLIQAVEPFRVVHANAAYYARQKEIGPAQSVASIFLSRNDGGGGVITVDSLESAIRLRFREPLPVVIHPVLGEWSREVAFYLVELVSDNEGDVRNVTTNAMFRHIHPRPARVVA